MPNFFDILCKLYKIIDFLSNYYFIIRKKKKLEFKKSNYLVQINATRDNLLK
jgi:hypothetical protein